VRTKRNTFDLIESVKSYCAHLRKTASGRGGEQTLAGLASGRTRLAREQADAQALKNAVPSGELVETAAVEQAWSEVLRGVRAAMLTVPSRVQRRVPTLSATEVATIDAEVRDLLSETGEANTVVTIGVAKG
jgi:terminase small subunit / prophage DNA-packing protein